MGLRKSIWKYPRAMVGEQEVEVPESAKFLCAAEQGGLPTVWAEVDIEAKKVPRKFVMVGTGQVVPNYSMAYIGTAFVGPFVWHVYVVA